VAPDENIVLSLRQGEQYVESLIGRKTIVQDKVVSLDEEPITFAKQQDFRFRQGNG
jgi:hypothetical protein